MEGQAIIITLILGAIAGWLGGQLFKGSGLGLIGNIVVGIIGGFIFVCAPTVPFAPDGWRGPEALRSFQHGAVLMQLDFYGIPYTLVEGSVADRVAQVAQHLATTGR